MTGFRKQHPEIFYANMRDRLTIYEQNVTLIVKPNKKNGENKMLESLKKKTLLGNLWCIIVLGIVTATLGVLFGSGIVKMLARPRLL